MLNLDSESERAGSFDFLRAADDMMMAKVTGIENNNLKNLSKMVKSDSAGAAETEICEHDATIYKQKQLRNELEW